MSKPTQAPSQAARLCAVTLVLWERWASDLGAEGRGFLDMDVTDRDGQTGNINLLTATRRSIAAFKAEHGNPPETGVR